MFFYTCSTIILSQFHFNSELVNGLYHNYSSFLKIQTSQLNFLILKAVELYALEIAKFTWSLSELWANSSSIRTVCFVDNWALCEVNRNGRGA